MEFLESLIPRYLLTKYIYANNRDVTLIVLTNAYSERWCQFECGMGVLFQTIWFNETQAAYHYHFTPILIIKSTKSIFDNYTSKHGMLSLTAVSELAATATATAVAKGVAMDVLYTSTHDVAKI